MEAAITLEGFRLTNNSTSSCGQQMPLTFLNTGESAQVIKVRGNEEMHHHLENLGFVPGSQVKVITEQAGNLIVEVKGAQVALDKATAKRIITG